MKPSQSITARPLGESQSKVALNSKIFKKSRKLSEQTIGINKQQNVPKSNISTRKASIAENGLAMGDSEVRGKSFN